MISVADAMERLRVPGSGLREIGTAADLASALDSQPRATPAAYVLVEETADKPEGSATGVHKQWVTAVLKVIVFVTSARAADSGLDRRRALEQVIGPVRERLLAWTPAPGMTPLALMAGRDERPRGSLQCHQLLFFTRYRIEVRA